MVNIGIIGLGPVWEVRYRPVLVQLRNRITVRAVHDSVLSRARQVATDFRAEVNSGILSLAARKDVEAVLLLDAGWWGPEALRLIASQDKPVYIGGRVSSDVQTLEALWQVASARGLTLMPEFGRRFTPATVRLQELMATRIGRPRKITVEAQLPQANDPEDIPGRQVEIDFLVGWFDWCYHLMKSVPITLTAEYIQSTRTSPSSQPSIAPGGTVQTESADCPQDCDRLIRLEFGPLRGETERRIAELHIHGRPVRRPPTVRHTQESPAAGPPRQAMSTDAFQSEKLSTSTHHDIFCEKGVAIVDGTTHVSWENGRDRGDELLGSERSEVEVMLDHFCRRVVGGLIPVADLNDVRRGIVLARAVARSLADGQPVEFHGETN